MHGLGRLACTYAVWCRVFRLFVFPLHTFSCDLQGLQHGLQRFNNRTLLRAQLIILVNTSTPKEPEEKQSVKTIMLTEEEKLVKVTGCKAISGEQLLKEIRELIKLPKLTNLIKKAEISNEKIIVHTIQFLIFSLFVVVVIVIVCFF